MPQQPLAQVPKDAQWHWQVWGGLSEEDREHIYARLDSRHYPRERGEGLRVASEEIEAAISPRALGIA